MRSLQATLRRYGIRSPHTLRVLATIALGESPRVGASPAERRSVQFTLTYLGVGLTGRLGRKACKTPPLIDDRRAERPRLTPAGEEVWREIETYDWRSHLGWKR